MWPGPARTAAGEGLRSGATPDCCIAPKGARGTASHGWAGRGEVRSCMVCSGMGHHPRRLEQVRLLLVVSPLRGRAVGRGVDGEARRGLTRCGPARTTAPWWARSGSIPGRRIAPSGVQGWACPGVARWGEAWSGWARSGEDNGGRGALSGCNSPTPYRPSGRGVRLGCVCQGEARQGEVRLGVVWTAAA